MSAVERFRKANPRLDEQTHAASLADAQFVIAREHGFESWTRLKRHIETLTFIGLEQFRKLARDLAAAYSAGDAQAIWEMNWNLGTSFVHDSDPLKMQQRLPDWFAAETRTAELALAAAQQLVARSFGFETWDQFAESVSRTSSPSHRPGMGSGPPFFRIDWKQSALGVQGPTTEKDWESFRNMFA